MKATNKRAKRAKKVVATLMDPLGLVEGVTGVGPAVVYSRDCGAALVYPLTKSKSVAPYQTL